MRVAWITAILLTASSPLEANQVVKEGGKWVLRKALGQTVEKAAPKIAKTKIPVPRSTSVQLVSKEPTGEEMTFAEAVARGIQTHNRREHMKCLVYHYRFADGTVIKFCEPESKRVTLPDRELTTKRR
jgi:hypothetical protein